MMTVLVIIFSPNAFAQVLSLRAGIAKTDITPTERLYMGGYEPNATRFDPVTEKIFVKGIEKLLAGLY